MRRDFARNHTLFDMLLKTRKQTPIRCGNPARRQLRRTASHDLAKDLTDGREDVVDLPLQVFLRRRELQTPFQMGRDLFLAERVPLDRRRGPSPLDQVDPVQLAGVGGWKDCPSDVIAPRGRLAEQRPVERTGALKVVAEADPRMGAAVFAVVGQCSGLLVALPGNHAMTCPVKCSGMISS